jgi:hypothetical protein
MTMSIFSVYDLDRAGQIFKPLPLNDRKPLPTEMSEFDFISVLISIIIGRAITFHVPTHQRPVFVRLCHRYDACAFLCVETRPGQRPRALFGLARALDAQCLDVAAD